jgi:hypothetical protein
VPPSFWSCWPLISSAMDCVMLWTRDFEYSRSKMAMLSIAWAKSVMLQGG